MKAKAKAKASTKHDTAHRHNNVTRLMSAHVVSCELFACSATAVGA